MTTASRETAAFSLVWKWDRRGEKHKNAMERLAVPPRAKSLKLLKVGAQRLTTTLDRRLLKKLPDLERTISLTTSVKLHVATVLDDAFLAFDRKIHRQQGKSMILELQPFDLIADMGAFAFARNFAHERGYKICIDGLSRLNLPLLQREHLGVDFAKISWRTEGKEAVPAEKRQNLAETIRRAGATRVILSDCDDEQAIEFGRSIGITLFQGRHVDTLLT